MRIVDTGEYVSMLKGLVEEGREVSLMISGSSMAPFLANQRDYIYFKKPDRQLKKGDMVFYQRQNGQYVMHRIYKVKNENYYIVGDGQREIEGPLQRNQIFTFCESDHPPKYLIPIRRSSPVGLFYIVKSGLFAMMLPVK